MGIHYNVRKLHQPRIMSDAFLADTVDTI